MSIVFDFNASDAEQLLLFDSFTKLCKVPFPVEAARAPVVMHYEEAEKKPSLIFLCNAYIHYRRVNPASTLRINGVPTRKYAIVPCAEFDEDEIENAVYCLNELGYYAYTVVVNDKAKLYVSWDIQCKTAVIPEETEDDGFSIPTT